MFGPKIGPEKIPVVLKLKLSPVNDTDFDEAVLTGFVG